MFKTSFKYHSDGLKSLKAISNVDKSVIPLCVIQSILSAIFPYIELFFSVSIINSIIDKDFQIIPVIIISLILSNLIIGIIIDFLNNIITYKLEYVQRKMLMLIKDKALEIDYETMEDSEILKKISNAEYAMEHRGGYNTFLTHYKNLLEDLFKIITSISLIIRLCLIMPISNNNVINFLASIPVSIITILIIILL